MTSRFTIEGLGELRRVVALLFVEQLVVEPTDGGLLSGLIPSLGRYRHTQVQTSTSVGSAREAFDFGHFGKRFDVVCVGA